MNSHSNILEGIVKNAEEFERSCQKEKEGFEKKKREKRKTREKKILKKYERGEKCQKKGVFLSVQNECSLDRMCSAVELKNERSGLPVTVISSHHAPRSASQPARRFV